MTNYVYTLWTTGHALEAGRVLYEQIPVAQRPAWAAALLEVCAELVPPIPQVITVISIARTPGAWSQSRTAFDALRQLTLTTSGVAGTYDLYTKVLDLAENVAKVTYNATGGSAPYDHHAGWRIAANVRHIVELHPQQAFEASVWQILCGSRAS